MLYETAREVASAYRRRGWHNIAKLIERVDDLPTFDRILIYQQRRVRKDNPGYEVFALKLEDVFLFFREQLILSAGAQGESNASFEYCLDRDCRDYLGMRDPPASRLIH